MSKKAKVITLVISASVIILTIVSILIYFFAIKPKIYLYYNGTMKDDTGFYTIVKIENDTYQNKKVTAQEFSISGIKYSVTATQIDIIDDSYNGIYNNRGANYIYIQSKTYAIIKIMFPINDIPEAEKTLFFINYNGKTISQL